MNRSPAPRPGKGRTAWPPAPHCLCLLLGLANALPAAGPRESERLDRTHLLEYRDARGRRQPVRTVIQWERRREEILGGMIEIMGPLPQHPRAGPPAVRYLTEVDDGRTVRCQVEYRSEPGSWVPAYLTMPREVARGGRKAPGVLCLHPTDDRVGHKVVLGLGGRAGRAYARELAERGYVTLAPAYPLLAGYQPDLQALGHASGTMKAIWDNLRGLDLLASLPEVASHRFAAIGHSLGGHNAVYTAVWDRRIKVVVSSCGLDSFLDYKGGDIRGWTSERYMPRLLAYRHRLEAVPFDFHELVGALAPRHCLIIAPWGDTNFKWRSVDAVAAAARPVYQLHGAGERLQVVHPDCGHDFPPSMRERAYRLIDEVLGGQSP